MKGKLFKKIVNKVFKTIWFNPDYSKMWEIDVKDSNKFIRFILSQAEEDAVWILDGVFDKKIIESLQWLTGEKVSNQGIKIILNKQSRQKINQLIEEHNLGEKVMCQYLFEGNECILISNDYLINCWVSKKISKEEMISAAQKYGFGVYDQESDQDIAWP